MSGAASPFAFASTAGAPAPTAAPPDAVLERMAAGAFRALCDHLRVRSDAVPNIDLMAVGGFCRNCLAKWMVLEARKLSKQLRSDGNYASAFLGSMEECQPTIQALDAFGYDEAALEVYGETYPEWKKRHQTKATEEQLRLYKESAHLHATHDAEALRTAEAPRAETKLSERVMVRLQAGAYLSLCHHLRARSDAVQNMDLMTVGGFCRNCLAKWLVVEARKISDQIGADDVMSSFFPNERRKAINALDSFGYDEAAQYVYGCTYPTWKKRHQKKATDAQMERYNGSKHLHAKHDKDLLATRSTNVSEDAASTAPPPQTNQSQSCVKAASQSSSLLSDVCCQDVDTVSGPSSEVLQSTASAPNIARPPKGSLDLRVGILTVSDRAASNAYESGDLSGPAVESALSRLIAQINATFSDQCISVGHLEKKIVADEVTDIQRALLQWSGKSSGEANSAQEEACDLVFTTGGTGFAKRDVTPEATVAILDRKCQALMAWASLELTPKQPLATLSRAAAGTCGNTLIVNLPGNPAGAAQVVEVMLPLLLHAIKDLRSGH